MGSVTRGTANGAGSRSGALGKSGNVSSASVSYTVNKLTAGAAVAMKFSLGGDYGLDILAVGSPSSQGTACAFIPLPSHLLQNLLRAPAFLL